MGGLAFVIQFFETTPFEVNKFSETLSNELSIIVNNPASVFIDLLVPSVARGLRVYRSDSTNSETLLAEVLFPDLIKKRPVISFPYRFIDSGDLTPGVENYPILTDLTVNESKVLPTPNFTLTEDNSEGSLASDEYFYRVTFLSEPVLGLPFKEEVVDIRLYKTDLSSVLVTSLDDISDSDYSLVSDQFDYAGDVFDTFSPAIISANGQTVPGQELKVGSNIIVMPLAQPLVVSLRTETSNVVVNTPVTVMMFPPDLEVEVVENNLVGPTQRISGIVTKVFTETGSITYMLSQRAQLLYIFGGSSIRVVS